MNKCETAYRKTFNAWTAGKYGVALELSRRFLHDFPEHDLGCVLTGIIFYELARYHEGEQVLRRAIRILPRERQHYAFLQMGDLHSHRGDYNKAITWFRKALKLNSGYTRGYIDLGKLLAKKGRPGRAEACFRKAVQCAQGPLDDAYLNLGHTLRAQGRYSKAVQCFKRTLELNPDNKEAMVAKKDVEKAMEVLSGDSASFAKAHDFNRGWREISRAYDKDHFSHTIELAKLFLAQFPDFHVAWVWYGHSLYRVGRYSEALRAPRRALRLFGTNRRHLVLAEFGHLHQEMGNFRQAEYWYRQGIATRNLRMNCHIYLGILLAKAGRFREAAAMHRKATCRKEGCPDEAYLNLGLVLRAQERYEQALACFQKALEIDPHYKEAKKAITDVKQALELRMLGGAPRHSVTAAPRRTHCSKAQAGKKAEFQG
ncbi:MAG: tetratricopeptide repeat protein [Verrucomicrobia bacterium]|nr:tetratricopeptide repeat protein [Verrucomicrobiota bacterium]